MVNSPNTIRLKRLLKHCKKNNVKVFKHSKTTEGNSMEVEFDTLSRYRNKNLRYGYKTSKLTARQNKNHYSSNNGNNYRK